MSTIKKIPKWIFCITIVTLVGWRALYREKLIKIINSQTSRSLSILSENIKKKRKKKPFPCFAGYSNIGKRGEDLKGLINIKIPKTASEVTASITLRLARLYSPLFKKPSTIPTSSSSSSSDEEEDEDEIHLQEECASNYIHATAYHKRLNKRKKTNTLLYTFVRKPEKRLISNFWYVEVSKHKAQPWMKNFVPFAERNHNFQMKYLNPHWNDAEARNKTLNLKEAKEVTKEIIDLYDFIGIVERYDESLVAFRLLNNLEISDVLYLPINSHGSYAPNKDHCVKIQSPEVSPLMEEYMSSEEYKEQNVGDYLLYKAANNRLNLHIARIGKSKFDKALEDHYFYLNKMKEVCLPKVKPICPGEGPIQRENNNCYLWGLGCGYDCIDELYRNLTELPYLKVAR